MPFVPSALERLLFGRLNLGPGFLLDVIGAGAFRAVGLAVDLGVFEALRNGPKTAAEIAHRIGTHTEGTRILLECLTSLGYLNEARGAFSNSSMTSKWLVRSSKTSLEDYVRFWRQQTFEFWDLHMEEAIRAGRPPITFYEWLTTRPGGWDLTQRAFASLARWLADPIAAQVKPPAGARRLLDVGGGHGLYSVAFCRRYPGFSATIFDVPDVFETTQRVVAAAGMGERITFRAGDFRKDDLGTGYDVALLFSVIHGLTPEENHQLFRRIAGALNPGGLLVVSDQFPDKTRGRTSRAATRFFALVYLVTLGGQTYPFRDVSLWLVDAGFETPHYRSARGVQLALATKPG